jgi:hypothetical protein
MAVCSVPRGNDLRSGQAAFQVNCSAEGFIQPDDMLAFSRSLSFRLAGQKPYHWPMDDPDLLPRHAARLLVEALADSPVVLIHGPRQCGKTTLARMVADRS